MSRFFLLLIVLSLTAACSLHNTSCPSGPNAHCHVELHADWDPACNGSCAVKP
jgi:hypothetical protein